MRRYTTNRLAYYAGSVASLGNDGFPDYTDVYRYKRLVRVAGSNAAAVTFAPARPVPSEVPF